MGKGDKLSWGQSDWAKVDWDHRPREISHKGAKTWEQLWWTRGKIILPHMGGGWPAE